MTDPQSKEPAKKEGQESPSLGIRDKYGVELDASYLSKFLFVSSMSANVLSKHECTCGNTGAESLGFDKQFAVLLDVNAVNCQCNHCKKPFSLGFTLSKDKQDVIFLRSYTMKDVQTIHSMSREQFQSNAKLLNLATETIAPML